MHTLPVRGSNAAFKLQLRYFTGFSKAGPLRGKLLYLFRRKPRHKTPTSLRNAHLICRGACWCDLLQQQALKLDEREDGPAFSRYPITKTGSAYMPCPILVILP